MDPETVFRAAQAGLLLAHVALCTLTAWVATRPYAGRFVRRKNIWLAVFFVTGCYGHGSAALFGYLQAAKPWPYAVRAALGLFVVVPAVASAIRAVSEMRTAEDYRRKWEESERRGKMIVDAHDVLKAEAAVLELQVRELRHGKADAEQNAKVATEIYQRLSRLPGLLPEKPPSWKDELERTPPPNGGA